MLSVILLSTSLFFGDSSFHASVSRYAVNTKTDKVVMEEASDKSLMPGSCIKTITTAAALQILGPEMRFETDLEYDGILDQTGTLHGNLYIRGGGDPCLGSDRIAGVLPWDQQIEVWVDAVQKLGVKKIKGQIIGDATRWEKALAPPSWMWEDLGNYYGAGACALSFHENLYTLTFKPGKEGDKTEILRQDPVVFGLTIENEVTTGSVGSGDNACIYGSEYTTRQFVRGTIPAGVEEFSIKGAIPDPARLCTDLLSRALEAKGIVIDHQKIEGAKRTVFHTTVSPTLKEIVYWTNQKSINLYAEHLLKKMGEVVFKEGSTKAGIKAVTQFLKSKNIDLEGFQMADGSGPSRKNLVTAKQFVSILSQIKKTDVFPIFLQSLPQVEEHVKAKSGSMSLVRGSVGYADDVIFAILVNQSLDPELRRIIKTYISQLHEPAKGS